MSATPAEPYTPEEALLAFLDIADNYLALRRFFPEAFVEPATRVTPSPGTVDYVRRRALRAPATSVPPTQDAIPIKSQA